MEKCLAKSNDVTNAAAAPAARLIRDRLNVSSNQNRNAMINRARYLMLKSYYCCSVKIGLHQHLYGRLQHCIAD